MHTNRGRRANSRSRGWAENKPIPGFSRALKLILAAAVVVTTLVSAQVWDVSADARSAGAIQSDLRGCLQQRRPTGIQNVGNGSWTQVGEAGGVGVEALALHRGGSTEIRSSGMSAGRLPFSASL